MDDLARLGGSPRAGEWRTWLGHCGDLPQVFSVCPGEQSGRSTSMMMLGGRSQLPMTLAQQGALLLLALLAAQAARLLVLPGAAARRRRLAYRLVNFGRPAKGLPDVPEVSRLSTRVVRVLGLNAGPFTLQGTNVYLVGTGRQRILVDAGDGNRRFERSLRKVLADERAVVAHVVVTHGHEDHVGGLRTVRAAFPEAKVWKCQPVPERDPTGVAYEEELTNGATVAVEGATLRAVRTPGHTADHVALVLEEEAAIFTGDCVLGSGTAVFEDLHDYVGSLRILQRELRGFAARSGGETPPGRLYPGHGLVVEDGLQRVEAYLQHRALREDQILAYLGRQPRSTVDDMVASIYADQNLNWLLRRGAKQSVRQHLAKLEREGRVARRLGGRWLLAAAT